MTPEQLKAALKAIRTESTTRSDFPFKIEEVNYTNDGVPTSIKGINVTPEQLDDALLVRIKPFSLSIHNEQDLGKAGERLQELSETLSAEILEKRGIGVAKLRELGIKEVREITFNSTLNSHFFTDEQRKKAKVWFENKEELEEAIEDYADNYPYDLFFYKCEFHNRTITNDKQQIVTSTEQTENRHVWGTYFVPKTKGTGKLQEKIKNSLKNMLLYKNGKEKVILLLLLDEATPKKDRLKWGHDDDDFSGSFQPNNCITCDFFSEKWDFLSHEIGHYLQMHFGLVQTLKDYQTEFANQLLLLNNNYSKNPISIPSEMREYALIIDGVLFCLFDKNYFECQKQLSLDKIFAYVQLLLRWYSSAEVSNILGVYFKGNTLYLNALSDIRELKRIRYTHNRRLSKKEIGYEKDNFKEEANKALFEKIIEEAYRYPVPTKMLSLLCRLHQCKNPDEDAKNVVCDFDLCSSEKEWNEKVRPLISEYIEVEP